MEENRPDTIYPGHSPNQTPTWTWKPFSRGVSLESVGCHYSHFTTKRLLLPLSSTGKVLQTGVWKLLRRSVKSKVTGWGRVRGAKQKDAFSPQNGRIFGWRGLEPRNLKMFGFVQAGHVLWDFKTVSPSALMVSFSEWTSFSRSSKSTVSISSSVVQLRTPGWFGDSITELRLLRCREKEEIVCRKQRVKAAGEEEGRRLAKLVFLRHVYPVRPLPIH